MIFIGIILLGLVVICFMMYREKSKVEASSRAVDRESLRLEEIEDRTFKWVTSNTRVMPFVSAVAQSLHKSNDKTYEQNVRQAIVWVVALVISWALAAIGVSLMSGLWYLKLVYFVAAVSALSLIFLNILSAKDNKFEDMIPGMVDSLNQEYGKNHDQMYALRTVADEVPIPVAKLLDSIVNTFEKTNTEVIATDLDKIKQNFNSLNVSTLVTLLHLVNVNGGGEHVEDQLEQLTIEINNDRDNERDIVSVVRPFIMGGLLVPVLGLWGIEFYSLYAAGNLLGDYFTSPRSYLYKILTMVGMTGFLWLMQFYQSRKVV